MKKPHGIDPKRLATFEKLPEDEKLVALDRLDKMDDLLQKLDLDDLEAKLPKDVALRLGGLAHDATPAHAG